MPQDFLGPASIYLIIEEIIQAYLIQLIILIHAITSSSGRKRKHRSDLIAYSMMERIPLQVQHLNRLVRVNNSDCITNLRMDRNTFGRLYLLLRQLGGLQDGKYVTVEEQVATFLGILVLHKKSRIVGFDYIRSGQTISRYLHIVLKAVLMLHCILLVKPEPMSDDCSDPRWKCFFKVKFCNIAYYVSKNDRPAYLIN